MHTMCLLPPNDAPKECIVMPWKTKMNVKKQKSGDMPVNLSPETILIDKSVDKNNRNSNEPCNLKLHNKLFISSKVYKHKYFKTNIYFHNENVLRNHRKRYNDICMP